IAHTRRAAIPCRAHGEASGRVLPGGAGVGLNGAISPAPLPVWSEVLVRLRRYPVGAGTERDRATEADHEFAAHIREGLREARGEQRAGQVAAAVAVGENVERSGRPGTVEVDALGIELVDVPGCAGGDHEVVS